MIVTLTLNPSVDRTLEIGELVRGTVNRADTAHVDPGGKGVNVSRALRAHGRSSTAVLPCGGEEGAQLVRLLRAEGVGLVAVPIGGSTRSNVTLVEARGTVTKLNETGPRLSDAEFQAVCDAVLEEAATARWVVVSGTAPPGVSVDAFADLCRALVGSGARLAVDTSGPQLRAAAAAGAHLLKPNRRELSEVVGFSVRTHADVAAAAATLRGWGAGSVLASLAEAGAVLVDDTGVWFGEPPQVTVHSSVGAGDAMLAGFLTSGAEGDAALAEALAWGAAAVSLPGSQMPAPGDIPRTGTRVRPGPQPQLSVSD